MNGWSTIPFRETGTWLSGGTPRRNEAAFWGGDIPWIGSKDLKTFDLDDSSEFVTAAGASAGTRVVEPGTVLFVVRGVSLAKEFRVGVATRRVAFNQDVKAIVPRSSIDGRFLAWFLRAKERYVLDQCDTATHGTKRLPLERIDGMAVPLPPLPEQRRIAAILDEADALRRKRREALGLLDELLRSAFLEMFGDPVANPRGWPIHTVGEILVDIETGWSPACEARPAEDNTWGVLKLGAVTTGRFEAEHKALPPSVEPRPALEVRRGDVLFSRKITTELMAAVVYVHEVRPRLLLPDLIFRLKPDLRRLHPRYLAACLMHPGKRSQVRALAAGSSGSMPGVSKAKLRTIELPVPPVARQSGYAALCEQLESTRFDVDRSVVAADYLFSSLLHRAFDGELRSHDAT